MLSTKERLYRGSILIEWALLYPTIENRLKANRVVMWELIDLEMAMVDEQIAEIRGRLELSSHKSRGECGHDQAAVVE